MQSGRRIFTGFWMAGFEGADHVNGSGYPLQTNRSNGHWHRLNEDYAALRACGIRSVRESVGWRLFDEGGRNAAARVLTHARIAAEHGVQVVWTLMHYGVPRDVDLYASDFPDRFARYCANVVQLLRQVDGPPPVFQPINEISFLAWAASETGLIYPYLPSSPQRGFELKRNLVRAALRGCDAIWSAAPDARILHTDPLVHIVAPPDAGEAMQAAATRQQEAQFQAWDMLCGQLEPELGGAPRYLDVMGLNYYHNNQWEHGTGERLHWHLGDVRRCAFEDLAALMWTRYRRPLAVAETGHIGEGRGQWLDHMAESALNCEARGIPLEAICLYPALDRHDWENPQHWHRSGLWDLPGAHAGDLTRIPDPVFLSRLRHWQSLLPRRAAATPLSPPASTPIAPLPSKPRSLPMTKIIVFSHLRWNFVLQRPQHLLSRLAAERPVVFFEEPVGGASEAWLERTRPCAGVEVLCPHVSAAPGGFHDDHLPALQQLLGDYLQENDITDYVVWFYTPMAFPLANGLTPRGIVYDCMDELTAFRNAPRQLVQRENVLLKAADLVFTGGPSLFESKRGRHPDVFCFPSSVDAAHFSQQATDHPAQAALTHPRLGYYGVIDERLDLALIAALADAHAEWQIVMVGPVVKIDPVTLPQRPNIHWMGQREYAELPQFLAGWDVCLLPFALNEATRFISPTKTLEYLAAGRPAVSTPIRDVVGSYAGIVEIAEDAPAFVEACKAILAWGLADHTAFQKAAATVVAETSWDRTVESMNQLLARFERPVLSLPQRLPTAAHGDAALAPSHYPTVVLGAGPTGLSAALELGTDAVLLERQQTVGGWCRSIVDNGFTFDYAGHIMFSTDPFVLELYERLLGENLHWQNREAWVYSKSVYTRYPFQGALYGLPPEVLKECLIGAIEARFGSLKKPELRVAGADTSTAPASLAVPYTGTPRNFEEFIYRVWGAGVAKHFAIPYNRKLWAVPLDEMETSWLGGRVPMPNLEEMIDGALQPVGKPMGPNARFGYPLYGGFQALMDGFLPLLECDLQLNAEVVAVSPAQRLVTLADGRRYTYDTLISTLPLPRLIAAMGDEAPAAVKAAAAALRHVSVRCVNLGIAREAITDKHWIYYPEETVFHRIFVQGNASPHCNPPGGFGLTCEITYSEYKLLPEDGEALIQRCIADCIKVGIIREDDRIIAANQVDMPYAYVVYDHARAAHVDTIRRWADAADILLSGRYSEWEYYNSDHAFVAGRKAALAAAARNATLAVDGKPGDALATVGA